MRLPRLGLILAALALGNSCSDSGPTGPGGGVLTLGTALSISGASGSEKFYTVTVPAGTPGLLVTLTGGSGDADLYLRFGANPTPEEFVCGSDSFGGDEECFVNAPTAGTWHIAVVGFESYSGVQLLARSASGPDATALTSGVPVTNLSGVENSRRNFTITVPAATSSLLVTTSGGTGDVDLEVQNGYQVPGAASCYSGSDTNVESCNIGAPPAGVWYITLEGFLPYTGVTLTATLNASSTAGDQMLLQPTAKWSRRDGRRWQQ